MRICLLIVAAASAVVAAQPAPRFDVVSVKRSAPGRSSSDYGHAEPGGRWVATNATLREMLMRVTAYRWPETVVGGPAWVDTDRFDVIADAGGPRPSAELTAMMETLLRDRFRLKTRSETRQMRGYALVTARSDGRLGPNLTPATCTREMPCPGVPSGGDAGIRANPAPISLIAAVAQSALRAPVVNRTGLEGMWSVHLAYDGATAVNPGAPGVSLFTALQEQLGLKLEPTQVSRDVLIIDSAERPTAD